MRKVLNSIVEYCEGLTPKIEVEAEVNESENPVQSKAVKGYVDSAIKNVKVEVDSEMSDESENAVSNKVIKGYVDGLVGDVGSAIDAINGEEV